jgi:hypothetical protein
MFPVTGSQPSGRLQEGAHHSWLDQGGEECYSRRCQQELLSTGWCSNQGIPPPPVASPPPAGPLEVYQGRLFETAQRDISSNSVRAYRTGWNKYAGFCAILGVDPISHGLDIADVFECFLLYCVEDALRRIIPDTANGYVSHVLKKFEHMGVYYDRETARSIRYYAVFKALLREYNLKVPKRLRSRFPFTIPFILWSFKFIDENFFDPALVRVLKAAFVVGHAFSLRPGEFLYSSMDYDCSRYLCASTTFAWFNGEAFVATETHLWPRDTTPSHITSTLDVRKNTTCSGGPVAVARNSSGGSFCCVSIIAEYLRHASLREDEPLMVYQGRHLNTKLITEIMKKCAVAHDVDPDRVVPACLRKNVITQMDLNTPQLQRQLQGGWRSNAGEESYWTNLLQVADAAERAVHNAGNATINVIRAIFQTPTAVVPRR